MQRGAAHARNAGASAAGELIAFCDADDVVTPNWLAELAAALEGADIVGGALEHDLLNDRATVGWRGGGESDLPRTHHFLPYAISCNCALRRSVWRELGGWSDRYWRGSGEDVELSWRAQLKGFRIAFAPAPWSIIATAQASARRRARCTATRGRRTSCYGTSGPREPPGVPLAKSALRTSTFSRGCRTCSSHDASGVPGWCGRRTTWGD